MTTALLLHSGNKNLEEIQQIVISTKAANLAKRAVGATTDLAMIAKKKQSEKYPNRPKINKECFNCKKKGHYARDCHAQSSNKRKPKELLEEAKRAWWKKNQQAKAAATRSIINYDDSDVELYLAGRAFMTRTANKEQLGVWYLDSYASRHICNSKDKFADLRVRTYKFVTARRDII